MIYARLKGTDKSMPAYTCSFDIKLVASTLYDLDEYKSFLLENNMHVEDEFIDDDFGTVCILPEDFKY